MGLRSTDNESMEADTISSIDLGPGSSTWRRMSRFHPCISIPPVPWMTSPVKYEPIGEARKTYATATSMGMPGLCKGASATPRESMASGGLPFVAGWSGVQLERESMNRLSKSTRKYSHDTWRNSVDSDPLGRLLLRQAPRESRDRAFRRAVIHHLRISHIPSNRTRIHDRRASLHVR